MIALLVASVLANPCVTATPPHRAIAAVHPTLPTYSTHRHAVSRLLCNKPTVTYTMAPDDLPPFVVPDVELPNSPIPEIELPPAPDEYQSPDLFKPTPELFGYGPPRTTVRGVPEPGTLALLGLAFVIAGVTRLRRIK